MVSVAAAEEGAGKCPVRRFCACTREDFQSVSCFVDLSLRIVVIIFSNRAAAGIAAFRASGPFFLEKCN